MKRFTASMIFHTCTLVVASAHIGEKAGEGWGYLTLVVGILAIIYPAATSTAPKQ